MILGCNYVINTMFINYVGTHLGTSFSLVTYMVKMLAKIWSPISKRSNWSILQIDSKTAFQLHIYPKDQYNHTKLEIHDKTRLRLYLLSANPESVCTVSPSFMPTAIWQPSWNSLWSSPVGNLKFLCSQM